MNKVEWRRQYREKCKLLGKCVYCGTKVEVGKNYCGCNRKNIKKYLGKYKELVFDHYGRRCVCCGEDQTEFLTIDHINGLEGTKRQSGSIWYYWIALHGYPDNLQVLCFNCNCAKGIYGQCPHLK